MAYGKWPTTSGAHVQKVSNADKIMIMKVKLMKNIEDETCDLQL